MKLKTEWYSERLRQKVTVARWGDMGTPVLLFPTAGGDAEEIERFQIIDCLADLLAAKRIKVYSCDSVGGRTMLAEEGTPEHRMRVINLFQEYVYHELVPAIRADCRTPGIEVISAGASIGAFNALAVIARYPDVFSKALCMSGTYDMRRFLGGGMSRDLYEASAVDFVPDLEGGTLEKLRSRFILLTSGEGKAEDIGESWRAAHILGSMGIPNRVDSWGPDWPHDWPTWRRMLPQYLGELAG